MAKRETALLDLINEVIDQENALYAALQQDVASPPQEPDPETLKLRKELRKGSGYKFGPRGEVFRLVHPFGLDLGERHSAAIAEAQEAGILSHLAPLIDELVQAHEAQIEDALVASGHRDEVKNEIFLRVSEASNRLHPYAEAMATGVVETSLDELPGDDLIDTAAGPSGANSANTQEVFSGDPPKNPDVRDLILLLGANQAKPESKRKSQLDIARKLTHETPGNDSKAKSLLAQVRRYKRKRRNTL